MNYNNLVDGDVVYLRVNPDVIPKGYMALVVRWEDGFPIGQEPGDRQTYRLDKWYEELEFEEPGHTTNNWVNAKIAKIGMQRFLQDMIDELSEIKDPEPYLSLLIQDLEMTLSDYLSRYDDEI